MTTSRMLKEGSHQYEPSFVELWDRLINWEKRQSGENGFFIEQLQEAGLNRVLDAAAGTGFHTVCLMNAGFEVLACDGNSAMIECAVENGRRNGLNINALVADWRELENKVDDSFDAIVCLGSSFPHLFAEEERAQTLQSFFAKLRTGGMLIIDHRNFDSIRAHRYQGTGNYYYCGKDVSVSVDHVDEMLCRFKYRFGRDTTHFLEVYPVLIEEMKSLLNDAGYSRIRTYGDFKEEFDVINSDFIIHTAFKF